MIHSRIGSAFYQRFSVLGMIFLLLTLSGTARAGKQSKKGYLGVSIEKLSEQDKEKLNAASGILVVDVEKEGPAEKAGIHEEDVIQTFDGEPMKVPDDLVKAVRNTAPETDVKIGLVRNGESKEIDVKIGQLKHFTWIDADKGKMFLKKFDHSPSVYLGVHLQDMDADLAGYFDVKQGKGALVLKVLEESPAEKAGIKSGDVIVKIAGEDVQDAKTVQKMVADYEEGDHVEIDVLRHGKIEKVTAELAENNRLHKVIINKSMDVDEDFDIEMNIPSEEEFEMQMEKMKDIDIDMEEIKEQLKESLENLEEKRIIIKKKIECERCDT